MIRGFYTAASGMLLGLRQQDVNAANLANAATVGYKAEESAQTAFAGVLAKRVAGSSGAPVPTTSEQVIGRVGTGTYVATVRTDLTQGSERETGATFDLMLRGDGFFTARTPEGVRYTRDGHLDRDEQNRLVGADGSFILDTSGNEITIDTDHVRVKFDGGIYRLTPTEVKNADGTTGIVTREDLIARLGVVHLRADDLVRGGKSKFALRDNAQVTPVDFATEPTMVMQGVLEEANVSVGQTSTRLFTLARTFEASQRVFTTVNETLQRAVRDVGKV